MGHKVNISVNDKSISWEEFREKFEEFFPYSYEPQRVAKMEEKYEEVTGRKPKKKSEPIRSKRDDKQAKGNDSASDAQGNTDESKEE